MTVDKWGDKWICFCTFAEKDVPKQAGFRWDPHARQWWTPSADIAMRIASPEARAKWAADLKAELESKALRIEESRLASSDVVLPCREGMAYLPYQCAGIVAAAARPGVLFGDEMGLGKTIQAIGLMNLDETLRKVLIVCPKTLLTNWYRELNKWLVRTYRIGYGSSNFFRPDAFDITIVNYDVLSRWADRMRTIKWDMIICDEAHLLKNPKAKRSRAIYGIDDWHARKEEIEPVPPLPARRKCFLTGTPIPNRVEELYPLVHYLAPEVAEFSTGGKFKRAFCGWEVTQYGVDTSGSSNLDRLQDLLRSTVMIRRLKRDVLKELPAKRRSVIEIPAGSIELAGLVKSEREQWEEREARLEELRARVELAKAGETAEEYADAVADLKKAGEVAFTEMSRIRKETAIAMIPYVIEHARNFVEEGQKIIIFGHHHEVIEQIAGAFGELAVTLYGPTKDRVYPVDRFQKDPECLVFVGGIIPAGVGITLTAASVVIFAELDWVPGNVTQAEDRAHRIGQKDMVTVQHLVLEGSLGARMAEVIVGKQAIQDAALDNETDPGEREEIDIAPALPSDTQAATMSSSRKTIEQAAALMTDAAVNAVHEALQLLSAFDGDRARELNGSGFSKIDSFIGNSLAETPRLSRKQAALGLKIVKKYHRQLPESLRERFA